jgi:hypothetical protein
LHARFRRENVLLEVTAMPGDDALFEKALARQMRERSLGKATDAQGASASGAADADRYKLCPDAEILAAYHERLLSSDEMNLWKTHIFSCARCQEVLSQLEATEEILVTDGEVTTGEDARVPTVHEGGVETGGSEAARLGAAAVFAAQPLAGQPPIAQPLAAKTALENYSPASGASRTTTLAERRRSPLGYWIAPLGAIAAALLVWVGMHGWHRQTGSIFRGGTELRTAENRPAPPPNDVPLAGARSDNKAASPREETTPDAMARQETAKNSYTVGKSQPIEKKKAAGLAEAGSTPSAITSSEAEKSSTTSADQVVGQATDQGPGSVAGNAPGHAARKALGMGSAAAGPARGQASTNAPQQNVEVSGAAGPVSQGQTFGANAAKVVTSQELQSTPTPDAPPAVPTSRDAQLKRESSSQTAAALLSAQAETVGKSGARLRDVAQQNAHIIPAPGGNIIWRVSRDGSIEQSVNAGAIWTQQNSGVTVALDSGSAPSEGICWVVGRGGTILQTVDGGGHWTKIISPIAGDLGGILAVDAQNATIWDTAKKNNFITADGGATWTRVANP